MIVALTCIVLLFLCGSDASQNFEYSPFPSLEKLYPLSDNGGYYFPSQLNIPSGLQRLRRAARWTSGKESSGNEFSFGPFSYRMNGGEIESQFSDRYKRGSIFPSKFSTAEDETKGDVETPSASGGDKSDFPGVFSFMGKKKEWSTAKGSGANADDISDDTFKNPGVADAAPLGQMGEEPQSYFKDDAAPPPPMSGRRAGMGNNKGRIQNEQNLSPPMRKPTEDGERYFGTYGDGNPGPIDPQSEEDVFQPGPLESGPVGTNSNFGGDAQDYFRAERERNPYGNNNNAGNYNRYQHKQRPQKVPSGSSYNSYRPGLTRSTPWGPQGYGPSESNYPYPSESRQRQQRSGGRRMPF